MRAIVYIFRTYYVIFILGLNILLVSYSLDLVVDYVNQFDTIYGQVT